MDDDVCDGSVVKAPFEQAVAHLEQAVTLDELLAANQRRDFSEDDYLELPLTA